MSKDDPPPEPAIIGAQGFRAALDAMQDHVTIGRAIRRADGTIEDFEILYMNAPTVDGAGRRPADLVGGRVRELFPAWERYGFFERFVQLVDEGDPVVVERFRYEDTTPEGTAIEGWWSVSAARLGDGYISATRDVTAAVRAERARHAEQRRQEQSRLAVELLQRAALPSSLPDGRFEVGARYEPAMAGQPVGGDWYDAFLLDDHRLGLVVGDVSGHGPEAAATMVQVRNVLRAYAHEHADPSTALDHVDAMLAATTHHELFVTCVYGVLDAEAGSFSWANAGHLPPLLLGSAASLLDGATAPPLGVDASLTTTLQTCEVRPGDQLVLFTDGLVEVRTHALESSLQSLARDASELVGLAPQRTADVLVERLIGRSDDVAVVVARFGSG
jgi:serine phosphatase RsbU (regulator of sigma subunit)